MTFIDSHSTGFENFEVAEHIGLRLCTENDLEEYSSVIGDMYKEASNAMLCPNDPSKLLIH